MNLASHLPTEIWTYVFEASSPKTIVLSLSRVCKLFAWVSEDCDLWKKKCIEKDYDLARKLEDQTWREFYFARKF